jgi:hypothetical protein
LASEPADKPGSVPGSCRGDDHLSRMAVTRHLERPTRKSTGASNSRPACRNPFCLALLPVGDAWPVVSPRPPVRSYRTVSPSPTRAGNTLLCCPIPPDHSAWLLASTVLYGARTFLSCKCNCDRLADSNAKTRIAEVQGAVKCAPRRTPGRYGPSRGLRYRYQGRNRRWNLAQRRENRRLSGSPPPRATIPLCQEKSRAVANCRRRCQGR